MATAQNKSKTENKLCLKQIYDGYLNKLYYNPVEPVYQLKYILDELKIHADESDISYDLFHKFLMICKTWFSKITPDKTAYTEFEKHVQMKMKELAKNNFKLATKGQVNKPISKKTVTVDFEEARKNKDGRFVMTVDCKMSQVASMRIDYSNLPDVTTSIDGPPTWDHPPLTVRSLVNWPYIGFVLHLKHVSIAHYTTHTYNRFLRLEGCEEELKIPKTNYTELTQGFDNRIGLQCRIETLLMYLCLTKQAVDMFDEISNRRKEEFAIIVETVIRALSYYKTKSCSINLECSYASSKYKFIREIPITEGTQIPQNLKKKSKGKGSKSSEGGGKLIEVMTPTFKFNISKCLFKYQTPKSERDAIFEYFKDILERRDSKKVDSFIQKINTDFSYLCAYCNAIYNENSFYKMEEHIHDLHGSESPWTCMGCNLKFDAYEMSMHNWKHTCK